MNVCFITPPSPFLLDERVFPALGILKVAAIAEANGHKVEHLDLNGVSNYTIAMGNHAQNSRSSVFCITATTPQMPAATRLAEVIRQRRPKSKLVIGGPHPTLVHAAYRTTSRALDSLIQMASLFDVIVAGDGEEVLEDALQAESPMVIDADNPRRRGFVQDVAQTPWPARHLIGLGAYHYEIEGVEVTPIVTQLGCPFGCHFCAGRSSPMLRRTRIRPTEDVIRELRHLYEEYGYLGFMFFDDELNVNPKLMELLEAMVRLQDELGIEFRCRGFVKSELFTEAQAEMLHRAGFRKIMCGFESGDDRILRNINKGATLSDNTRTMEISHKYGLGMKALMSLGHPGETESTAHHTLEWLLGVEPEDFDCTIITAYPGSPYYDEADQMSNGDWVFEVYGDRLYMVDINYSQVEDFYKGSLDSYKSYVYTDLMSRADLVWARDHIERTVRDKLGIPYYKANPALKFESSMGMLPGSIYRRGNNA
jgi:anaerobic magnesium-protoporphyrin IX monomethyl ester cyclase